MAGAYNCEALVSSIRRRAFLPTTDNGADYPLDSDIIAIINEELPGWIVPFFLDFRQQHFSVTVNIPLVAGQANYTVPSRALGADVSFIQIVDQGGSIVVPEIVQQDPELATQYPYGSTNLALPASYFFRSNDIVLVPTPAGGSYFLRIEYPQRPNQLTPTANVGVVTSTSQGASTFTVNFSGTVAGVSVGSAIEVAHAASGFEIVSCGACTASGAGALTFAGTRPTGINVGDYVCLQDTAPVLTNVPADLIPLVTQWVALRLLGDRGTGDQFDRATKIFESLKARAETYLGKRDRFAHHKIVPRSRRRLPAMLYRG